MPFTRSRRLRRSGTAGIIAVVAALVAVGAYVVAREGAKAGRAEGQRAALGVAAKQLKAGCAVGALRQGYLVLRAREFTETDQGHGSVTTKLAPRLFRTPWCERTYAEGYVGPRINLPRDAEECFLKLEYNGWWNDRQPFTDPARLLPICRRAGNKLKTPV